MAGAPFLLPAHRTGRLARTCERAKRSLSRAPVLPRISFEKNVRATLCFVPDKHVAPEECLRLLATVPVGRVGVTIDALPAVLPVNFVMTGGAVVFASAAMTGDSA